MKVFVFSSRWSVLHILCEDNGATLHPLFTAADVSQSWGKQCNSRRLRSLPLSRSMSWLRTMLVVSLHCCWPNWRILKPFKKYWQTIRKEMGRKKAIGYTAHADGFVKGARGLAMNSRKRITFTSLSFSRSKHICTDYSRLLSSDPLPTN